MSELDDLERDGLTDDFVPKTKLHYHPKGIPGFRSNGVEHTRYGNWVELADIQCLLLEMYEFAIEMGYETKLLNIIAIQLAKVQKRS